MKRVSVKSSNIRSIGFEGGNNKQYGTLEVEFQTGDIYQYENFLVSRHQELMSADSIGSYFDKFVKRNCVGKKVEHHLSDQAMEAAKRISELSGFGPVEVIAQIIDEEMTRERRETPRFSDLMRATEKVVKTNAVSGQGVIRGVK